MFAKCDYKNDAPLLTIQCTDGRAQLRYEGVSPRPCQATRILPSPWSRSPLHSPITVSLLSERREPSASRTAKTRRHALSKPARFATRRHGLRTRKRRHRLDPDGNTFTGKRVTLLWRDTSSVGKTWIACVLGHRACRDNRAVLSQSVPPLLEGLGFARGDGRYARCSRAWPACKC
jgi:hypothetical protein